MGCTLGFLRPLMQASSINSSYQFRIWKRLWNISASSSKLSLYNNMGYFWSTTVMTKSKFFETCGQQRKHILKSLRNYEKGNKFFLSLHVLFNWYNIITEMLDDHELDISQVLFIFISYWYSPQQRHVACLPTPIVIDQSMPLKPQSTLPQSLLCGVGTSMIHYG